VLSLESFSRLHFPDGRVRPEFWQKLLDSGITPEQIAWLEEDVAEEMEEWRRYMRNSYPRHRDCSVEVRRTR
jgi:hypothetical protein